jgi:hypothetical protein
MFLGVLLTLLLPTEHTAYGIDPFDLGICHLSPIKGEEKMGLTGMAFSTVSFAAGAVMYWAITAQGHGFRYSTIGVILMIVGVVGFIASAVIFATSRRPAGSRHRSYDREVTDAQGHTASVHEEVH